MKRLFTATCLAATCAVGLAAQSTGTSGTTAQDPQGGGQRAGGGPRTVTGCLRAGDTAGTYMLTDVMMQGGGGRRGGDATTTGSAAGGTTTGSTTSGTTGTTASGTTAGSATAGGGQGRGPGGPQSIMLTADSSVDLKPHVGHKIEVVGTMAGGRQGGGAAGTATATGTGTTAGSTTAGAGTTASGSATGTGTGTTAAGGGQRAGGGPRNMTVTSIRMISESCS